MERYFARHEFSARYLLSSSDCDGYPMSYILEKATPQEREWWEALRLGYTESTGSVALRRVIASFYTGMGEDNVVVSSPGELNYSLMQVLLGASAMRAHVVATFPAYQSLYEPARAWGCDLSFWEPEPGTWTFDTAVLRKLVRPNTKLIIINFPHNPTGACLSVTQLREVTDMARGCGAWLYSDEMYRDLLIDPACEKVPAVCDLYERGISLWGMAKSFGLAGLRIGWLACRDRELLGRVTAFKDYLSICSSAPSEVLAAIALRHSQDFLGPNVAKIRTHVGLFASAVKRLACFGEFVAPRAGSVAFVPLQVKGSALEFSDSLVERTGIMTVPSELFAYPGKYLRIGFGRENFPQVLELLEKSL